MQTKTQNNIDANKAIVMRFANEVINNKHFELIDELWSQNMAWHGGSLGKVYGIEQYKKILGRQPMHLVTCFSRSKI